MLGACLCQDLPLQVYSLLLGNLMCLLCDSLILSG